MGLVLLVFSRTSPAKEVQRIVSFFGRNSLTFYPEQFATLWPEEQDLQQKSRGLRSYNYLLLSNSTTQNSKNAARLLDTGTVLNEDLTPAFHKTHFNPRVVKPFSCSERNLTNHEHS